MANVKDLPVDERLFDALHDVFSLETDHALTVSKEAACLIATFYVDKAVTDKTGPNVDVAISRVREMQAELSEMVEQLQMLKAAAGAGFRH